MVYISGTLRSHGRGARTTRADLSGHVLSSSPIQQIAYYDILAEMQADAVVDAG